MKKNCTIILVLGFAIVHTTTATHNIPSQNRFPKEPLKIYFFNDESPHTKLQIFLEALEQKIQLEGKTNEIIGECIDYILKEELPLEDAIDMIFEKTTLKPNDTIQGCHPHTGGCNYSFFQLITIASLFTDFHNQYKRILARMLLHGGDPELITVVKRGIINEQTTACKELAYWQEFTNRHALKALDELEHAVSEQQAQAWLKDLSEAEKSFHYSQDIQELFYTHLQEKVLPHYNS